MIQKAEQNKAVLKTQKVSSLSALVTIEDNK